MAGALTKKRLAVSLLLLAFVAFLGWRFVRPMNIFVVSESFERPVPTDTIPEPLETLSAVECAACHRDIYDEWATSMHSKAWTDPYFRVDFEFDGAQQICMNCHIPLDRQQENRVIGFRDAEKWDPILEPNPDFDAALQREGVTCAACHLRAGRIVGVLGGEAAPHPVRKIASGNEICVQCHVVDGERWDTFFRFPPCGTVAEIRATRDKAIGNGAAPARGGSGEMTATDISQLGCVECHMPAVRRAVAEGGEIRSVRRHLWRGGHDPEMVKSGLDIAVREERPPSAGKRRFTLSIANVGAAHYLPTGTPDRHLTVRLAVRDVGGRVLAEENYTLRRTILWRPVIVDLWDTRLARGERRDYNIEFASGDGTALVLDAEVRYFLVDEKRRKRIGYDAEEETSYSVFRRSVSLDGGS